MTLMRFVWFRRGLDRMEKEIADLVAKGVWQLEKTPKVVAGRFGRYLIIANFKRS